MGIRTIRRCKNNHNHSLFFGNENGFVNFQKIQFANHFKPAQQKKKKTTRYKVSPFDFDLILPPTIQFTKIKQQNV